MTRQDRHFYNIVSVVIGVLIAIAVVLFAASRIIAGRTQVPETFSDPAYVAQVVENIRPFARVAVAGQDNSALAIQAAAPASAPAVTSAAGTAGGAAAANVPKDGRALYEATCRACHEAGLAGAPKTGDRAAWAPRLAQGKATLYEHALKGYTGKTGMMPPKGARTDLSDDLIRQGVDYLVSRAQ